MDLTKDEIDLIFAWYSWAVEEEADCAWSDEADALLRRLQIERNAL